MAVLGTVNTPAQVAFPKENGKIAFSSTGDCNEETCVTDSSPAWSPDNNRMVFDSNRGADPEILVMDATGASRDQLTTNSSSTADFEPAWQLRPEEAYPGSGWIHRGFIAVCLGYLRSSGERISVSRRGRGKGGYRGEQFRAGQPV